MHSAAPFESARRSTRISSPSVTRAARRWSRRSSTRSRPRTCSSGRRCTRDSLLARMRDHIHTLVGRYKGRVKGWDVVNEALNEDGTLRKSPWLAIIGEDFIAKAFQFAHEADPAAELYYNDYSVENAPKRNGAVQLISKL